MGKRALTLGLAFFTGVLLVSYPAFTCGIMEHLRRLVPTYHAAHLDSQFQARIDRIRSHTGDPVIMVTRIFDAYLDYRMGFLHVLKPNIKESVGSAGKGTTRVAYGKILIDESFKEIPEVYHVVLAGQLEFLAHYPNDTKKKVFLKILNLALNPLPFTGLSEMADGKSVFGAEWEFLRLLTKREIEKAKRQLGSSRIVEPFKTDLRNRLERAHLSKEEYVRELRTLNGYTYRNTVARDIVLKIPLYLGLVELALWGGGAILNDNDDKADEEDTKP